MKKYIVALLALVMAFALCACGGTELADLSGDYQDEVSQRCTLVLTSIGENEYQIGINWPISAWEGASWEATGTFDGEKIFYNDGISYTYLSDDDGNITKDNEEEGLAGTLIVGDDGKIEWAGSTKDEKGMFVKITTDEE